MKQLVRGQRIKLGDLAPPASTQWIIKTAVDAPGKTIDWCCFGLDGSGHLADDRYFVFYNQPSAPQNVVRWNSTSNTSAEFSVSLATLPPTVRRLVFTANIDGIGTMNQMRNGHLSLVTGGQEVANYRFAGADFLSEAALIVGEIYWKDEWRFNAVGQGFDGGLSALLKHFGGEEIVEDAPPTLATPPLPSRPAPSAPPPAPISPPVVVSMPVTPPPVMPQSVPRGDSLQSLIDAATPGTTISLTRDEYAGPIHISKPLTIEGRGSVIWAAQGPVVTVNSLRVELRNLEIEVTVPEEASGEGDIALKAAPSAPPHLDNVQVRGRIQGLNEDGDWSLPPTLHLGHFAPRARNDYRIYLRVPVDCTLRTAIAGLRLEPCQLTSGTHEVILSVEDVAPETLLLGHIEVHSPVVTRSIPISGNTLRAEGTFPAQQVVLWRE